MKLDDRNRPAKGIARMVAEHGRIDPAMALVPTSYWRCTDWRVPTIFGETYDPL